MPAQNHFLLDPRTNTFSVLNTLDIKLPSGPWITEDITEDDYSGMEAKLVPFADKGVMQCYVILWIVDSTKDKHELDVRRASPRDVEAWDIRHMRQVHEMCERDGVEIERWTPSMIFPVHGFKTVHGVHMRKENGVSHIYVEYRFPYSKRKWVVVGAANAHSSEWAAMLRPTIEGMIGTCALLEPN